MSSLNKLDSTGEAMCEPALLNSPLTSNCRFSGLAERGKKPWRLPPALHAPLHHAEHIRLPI